MSKDVANNGGTTPKLLGGITGKGFMPGKSGNPSGRPKRDIAAEIAQAVFQAAPEQVAKVFLARLKKGDSRTFTALADRAYGKAPESITVNATVEHHDLSRLTDEQLDQVAAIVESAKAE